MKNLYKIILANIFILSFNFNSFSLSLNKKDTKDYKNSRQMILILTGSWDDFHGTLQRFERNKSGAWISVGERMKVVLGKHGTAWGEGMHEKPIKEKLKKEKDGNTPAGVFKITKVFFKDSALVNECRMEHILINNYTVAIDDPKSKYYNKIVDLQKIKKNNRDWLSHKTIKHEELYNIGIVIDHNYPPRKNSIAGSHTFMHKMKHSHKGTTGGIGIEKHDLKTLFLWLNKEKSPIFVTMPIQKYKACPKSVLKDLPPTLQLMVH